MINRAITALLKMSSVRKKVLNRIEYEIKLIARRLGYEVFQKKAGFLYTPDIYQIKAPKLIDLRDDGSFYQLAKNVINNGTTLLSYPRLHLIYQAIENSSKNNPGPIIMAEVGVHKGGGSRFMVETGMKFSSKAKLYSVDTFTGHDACDVGKLDEAYHHAGKFLSDYQKIKDYLSGLPVEVIQGRIQDVGAKLDNNYFHVVHIDTDLYAPTKYSLEFFGKRLHNGGTIIVDDALSATCKGVRKAIEEFVAQHGTFRKFYLITNQCLIVKNI